MAEQRSEAVKAQDGTLCATPELALRHDQLRAYMRRSAAQQELSFNQWLRVRDIQHANR